MLGAIALLRLLADAVTCGTEGRQVLALMDSIERARRQLLPAQGVEPAGDEQILTGFHVHSSGGVVPYTATYSSPWGSNANEAVLLIGNCPVGTLPILRDGRIARVCAWQGSAPGCQGLAELFAATRAPFV
jgi:hypothetical protein